MKPRIHKRNGDWTFSHAGEPFVPFATVVHEPCPSWQDAIRACDLWHRQRDFYEGIKAMGAGTP